MNCLRTVAVLHLKSGFPEMAWSHGSEQRARHWQPSKLDFSTVPTDGLAEHLLFFGLLLFLLLVLSLHPSSSEHWNYLASVTASRFPVSTSPQHPD